MRSGLAISLKLCAVTLFVVMSALVKAASDTVPPGEAVFFRALCAVPVILAWLMLRGELREGLRIQSRWAHLWRGLLGTSAMGMKFAALALLPLPEVTAISYATPLLVVIFAGLFLGERVRAFRLSMVVLGFAGVLIILWPRLTGLGEAAEARAALGAGLALGGATAAALAHVTLRRMTATEGTAAIVFWFSVTASVLSLATLPWGWVAPPLPVLAMLVAAGLLGGTGQIFLTSAYRFGDASVVAPFDYASMLLALVIGYVFFADMPTVPMLAGSGLVILAGLSIIWRERRLGLERGRARAGMTPQG